MDESMWVFIRNKVTILFLVMLIGIGTDPANATGKKTINYRPGLGQNAPKLDIYGFGPGTNAPVLIYVHGGAWKRGSRRQVGQKPVHYNKNGYVFVSVDYRLVPLVHVEDQLDDLDHAFGWIVANIAQYGGDANNLHLVGHSAGAHLVSLTGMNPGKNVRLLIEKGSLRSVISNDTIAYDMPRIAAVQGGRLHGIYGQVFGQEEERWKRLSPQNYASSTVDIPAFLLLYSGKLFAGVRKTMTQGFYDQLKKAGADVTVFDGYKFTHRQMTVLIGVDNGLTGAIDGFLERYNK